MQLLLKIFSLLLEAFDLEKLRRYLVQEADDLLLVGDEL